MSLIDDAEEVLENAKLWLDSSECVPAGESCLCPDCVIWRKTAAVAQAYLDEHDPGPVDLPWLQSLLGEPTDVIDGVTLWLASTSLTIIGFGGHHGGAVYQLATSCTWVPMTTRRRVLTLCEWYEWPLLTDKQPFSEENSCGSTLAG